MFRPFQNAKTDTNVEYWAAAWKGELGLILQGMFGEEAI